MKAMSKSKSVIIRYLITIILMLTWTLLLQKIWSYVFGVELFFAIISMFLVHIMVYAIAHAHTQIQKEIDEQEGDFMCDC